MNLTRHLPILTQKIVLLALWSGIAVSASSLARAQDDPFSSDDPFNTPASDSAMESEGTDGGFDYQEPAAEDESPSASATATDAKSDPLDRNLDPLIAILRENPPRTLTELGRAIGWMTQLGHWAEVSKLLDQVNSKKPNQSQLAEVARAAGGGTWIRLRQADVGIDQPRRDLVTSILAAPANVARDASVIDGWIDQLASGQPGQRRLAQLRLQDGSKVAVARLVERLLEGNAKATPEMLAGSLVQFGSDGIEALQAACNLSDDQRRARALLSVAELTSNHFPMELAGALHSASNGPEVQAGIAEKLLKRYPQLPSEPSSADHLQRGMLNALAEYQRQRLDANRLPIEIWMPSDDGRSVLLQPATSELKALERLHQLASIKAQLIGALPDDQAKAAAIFLQRAYHQKPSMQMASSGQVMPAWLNAHVSSGPDFLISVFRQATQWEMHGAAVRSVQVVAGQAQSGQYELPLDFFSDLLNDSRGIIRYQALAAIAAANPRTNFRGSERALATAVEMTGLAAGPKTLVIGASLELCLAAEPLIVQQTSGQVVIVNSGREALRALSQTQPAEMVAIVDRVRDMSLYELMQRVGKTTGGGSIPIAVLTDQIFPYELRYIESTSGIHAATLTRNAQQMEQIFQKMISSLDTGLMTSEDRGQLSQVAQQFLTTIVSDQSANAFYPLADWHAAILSAQASQPLAVRAQGLSAMGTVDSQWRLVQLAGAAQLNQEDRLTVASAFEKSIRQFGNLLDKQQVQSLYDLYNRLGPNDPAIAKALGYMLDIIEGR
jgi:hypothetical protein